MRRPPGRKGPSISTTGNPHWCTPDWVIEIVRAVGRGVIHLDPCSNPRSIVGALIEWYGPRSRARPTWKAAAKGLHITTRRLSGLEACWSDAALWAAHNLGDDNDPTRAGHPATFYMNPPYQRDAVGPWTAAARIHGSHPRVQGMGLLPARLSSAWWRASCVPPRAASAVCFLGKRVKFIGADSAPAWETGLVYWGPDLEHFIRVARDHGEIWTR